MYQRLLLVLLCCLFSSNLYAVCSSFQSQASINEVYRQSGNNKPAFFEIKLLNNFTGSSSDYNNWSVKVCYENNDCKTVNVNLLNISNQWLYSNSTEDQFDLADHFDFKDGFDMALFDGPNGTGNYIDYIQIGGYSQGQLSDFNSNCGYGNLDYVEPIPNTITNGTVILLRQPDGTGQWFEGKNTNQYPITPGENNGGEEPATLILHYEFDEGTGQLASDSSANNRDANLGFTDGEESNDAEWACNITGGHLNFTGSSSQRVTGPNFAPPEEGTVAFWLKVPATPTGRQRVFGFDDGFELRWEGTGVMHWDINKTGVNNVMVSNGAVTETDTWIHLAFTTNVNTNDWAFYKNGVLNNSGNYEQLAQPADPLTLGTRTGSSNYFTGSLDDFRLYDGELSASEIAALAANPPVDKDCPLDLNFCDTTFVDGLTSHSNSGSITFNNRVTIFDNPDDTLAASSLDPTTHQNGGRSLTCDGFGFCSSSGTPTQSISEVGSFLTTSSSTNFTVGNNGLTCTIGEAASDDCSDQTSNEYNVVRVNNDGTLFFSANYTEYRIKELIAHDRGVIYLSAGDYWIETLNFNNDTQLIIQGSGRVNLYINNSANRFADRAKVNISGDDENLFIYSYDDLRINNDVDLKGFIYSAQTLILGARLDLTGAASAANLTVGDDAEINYTCPSVAPVAIDHYQIIHDATGLTCEAETVTIKACTNADTATCTEYTSPTTVDLSVDGLTTDITQTAITFTGNTTVNFQYILAETVVLGLNNTSVVATNNTKCINGNTESNCNVIFESTAFVFDANSITNQVSGVEFDGINVQALKDNEGVCENVFNGDLDVNIAMEYTNPIQETNNNYLIGSTVISANDSLPITYNEDEKITLNFNSDSIAVINGNKYLDAGQIRLHINFTDDNGVIYNGTSDTFWVRPNELVLSAFVNNDATPLDNDSATGMPFHYSGENFNFEVKAVNTDGDITTNYMPNDIQLSVSRLLPSDGDGGVDGLFTHDSENSDEQMSSNASFSSLDDMNFTDGEYKSDKAQFSEVGVINLDIQDIDYGGVSNFNVPATEITVGRFTPAKFVLDSSMVSAACNNIFTYMGDQNIDIAYTIHALNANDILTQNYIGAFAKSTVKFVAENNEDAVDRGDRLPAITQNWGVDDNAGKLINPIASLVAFQRESEPDGPFESLNIGLKLEDPDGATLQNLNLRADTTGACTDAVDDDTDCDAILLGTTSVRYGRLVLQNAYGPETSNLLMPMQVEYLNAAGQYVVNTDDNCTSLDISNGEVTYNVNNFTSLEPTAVTSAEATAGKINLIELVAPNARGNVTVTMKAPTWLTFDWDDDDTLESPSALATFGLFRGNDRIIQWREIPLQPTN